MHGDEVNGKCWGRDHAWKKKCLENDVVLEQRKCNGDNSWVFFLCNECILKFENKSKEKLTWCLAFSCFFFSFLFLPFSFSLSLFSKIDPLQECFVFFPASISFLPLFCVFFVFFPFLSFELIPPPPIYFPFYSP